MTDHPNYTLATQNLQRYLRQLSYDELTIPPVPIDGIFESRTEEALREFQRLRGFPVTGSADQETWERLYADYRASLALNSPPRAILVFPLEPPSYVLDMGSRGFPVLALQYMLLELHQNYLPLVRVELTGEFDGQTANAVRVFQSLNQLPANGAVGQMTWDTIADQYNVLFLRQGVE
ncbi:MAG: peptidoglycan-binding protein [Clostridia bacterium]|nr:peptidoglycan-binding protein [Clostridia bacterium]